MHTLRLGSLLVDHQEIRIDVPCLSFRSGQVRVVPRVASKVSFVKRRHVRSCEFIDGRIGQGCLVAQAARAAARCDVIDKAHVVGAFDRSFEGGRIGAVKKGQVVVR